MRGISLITFLAILIAFFGLLGMVVYDTDARVKEIGIRKIMGASMFDIIRAISKNFIFLLLLAAILATPVAWIVNHLILQSIENRIELGIWTFVMGLAIMFSLGFITIFSLTVKAASGNPVNSLRYE